MDGWYTRYPQWFNSELALLRRNYPQFRLDEGMLRVGLVVLYGELMIRPPGGTKRHPVRLVFPSNSPYAYPSVMPIQQMPTFDTEGAAESTPDAEFFDRRHQMPNGVLCLFQYETRVEDGGESIRAIDVLKRAEAWFMGHATGRWPPDSIESELQSHFYRSQGILLSKVFYSDDLHGCGEFFAVSDIHRVYVGKTQHEPPLIMTAATIGNGIVEVIDAKQDLEHIFPWLTNDAWQPQAFLEWQERQRQRKQVEFGDVARIRGCWWQLPSEPAVFRDGKGLLSVLATVGDDVWPMVSEALGTDLTLKNVQHVGLCYPGRSGRREWLFLKVKTGTLQAKGGYGVWTEDEKRERFEKADVACIPAHGLTPKDINSRNETTIASPVAQKKVALLGLGALGSKVAELLAQAGVAWFKLCDGDKLHVGNVARHVGGLSDSGAPKTEVVGRRIWDVNPYAHVEVREDYANPAHREVQDFFTGVDLIICTIADEGAESGFNDLAIAIGTPVIYGRALRRGQMGRVFIVRPGTDACKTCLSMISKNHESQWISITERPEDALLHECGRPVIAGSAVDLSFVAGFVARQAIDLLEGRSLSCNHLVWSRERAQDISEKLSLPYSVVQSSFERQTGCPSCGAPEIMTIELPKAVRVAIETEVASSPTVETGGILIGRIEGNKALIVRATGPGPNAKRTASVFERDIEFAQAELDAEAGKGLGNRYVGEWHSHLVASPEPSGRDVLSMTGIAEASNYATDCPVMMICGFDPKSSTIGDLKAWVFPKTSSGRAATIVTDGPENNALTTPTP